MLRLFHDFTSPASALAVLRVHDLLDGTGAVEFTGLDILGLARPVPPTIGLREELEQHREALRAAGLEARRPHLQPPTLHAHVVGVLAEEEGRGRAWRELCYRLYWERGVDLSDHGVLVAIAERVGLTREAAVGVLTDEDVLQGLRRRTTGHRRRGVGGVPVLESAGTFVPALLEEEDLRRLASL